MCAIVREKKHSLFNIDGDKKIEHGFKNYFCIVVVLTSHHFCTASSVCSSSFSDSKSRLNYIHNSVGKIKKIRSQDFLKTLRLFPFISNARYFRKVVIVALKCRLELYYDQNHSVFCCPSIELNYYPYSYYFNLLSETMPNNVVKYSNEV